MSKKSDMKLNLETNSVLAMTARAQPDTESMDQAHIRIGSATAAHPQLEELLIDNDDDTDHS